MVIDGVEEVAEGPKEKEDRDMQEHVYPVHEPPHPENFKASKQMCSDTPTCVRSGPGMGKIQVFITPLLDESTSNRAHRAQKEAEKQHDIDAKGAIWGLSAAFWSLLG